MNNVHEDAPVAFESRWALSYLRGPLTRAQIKTLMNGRQAAAGSADWGCSCYACHESEACCFAAHRTAPGDLTEIYCRREALDQVSSISRLLLGAAQIRYIDTKAKIDYLQDFVVASPLKDDNTPVEWEESFELNIVPDDLENEPIAGAEFAPLPADAAKPKSYTAWNKDLVNWIYSNRKIDLYCSPSKECSQPGESEGDFRARVQHSSREQRDSAVEKLRQKYASKVTVLAGPSPPLGTGCRERERATLRILPFRRRGSVRSCLRTQERHNRNPLRLTNLQGAIRHRPSRRNAIRLLSSSWTTYRRRSNRRPPKSRRRWTRPALRSRRSPIKPKKTNINVRMFTLAWAPYAKDSSGELKPAWD